MKRAIKYVGHSHQKNPSHTAVATTILNSAGPREYSTIYYSSLNEPSNEREGVISFFHNDGEMTIGITGEGFEAYFRDETSLTKNEFILKCPLNKSVVSLIDPAKICVFVQMGYELNDRKAPASVVKSVNKLRRVLGHVGNWLPGVIGLEPDLGFRFLRRKSQPTQSTRCTSAA